MEKLFEYLGIAGKYVIDNWWKFLSGILIIIVLAASKDYILSRLRKESTIVIDTEKKKINLNPEAEWILCVYDQKDCAYKNAGLNLNELTKACGSPGVCDKD